MRIRLVTINMADETFLEFLLINNCRTVSQEACRTKRTVSTTGFLRLARKKRMNRMLLAMSTLLLCNPPIDRGIWVVPRSDHWFEMVETTLSDKEWYENFRVSRETFHYILFKISTEITRKDTRMRKAISSRKRVAITLYYMGSTAEYRTVANLFGVSTAFVCLCVKDVSTAVLRKLKARFLSIPKGDDLREVMRLYKQKWGFPLCAGSVDGTHIRIRAPAEDHTDYVNRKNYHSIVMQALVDSRYLFRDVVVGWPGSVHDARVLSNSELYDSGRKGHLFDTNIKETILGVDIGPVIIGDPAYPLLEWLMKAYPENENTPRWQRHFNYRLSRARMSVENTFGRWKGRFRRFLKRVDMEVASATYLVAASCILHNICELRRDDFLQEWLEEVQRDAIVQPDSIPLIIPDGQIERDASIIRDTLGKFFMTAEGQNIGSGGI